MRFYFILTVVFFSCGLFAQGQTDHDIHVYQKVSNLHKNYADLIADTVRENPKALIGSATGGTFEKIYTAFVNGPYTNDSSLDLSEVRFYNLDNYLGLPKDSLMNYWFYMEYFLFKPMRDIDPSRAPKPENTFMHGMLENMTEEQNLSHSLNILNNWLSESKYKKFDLMTLGLGGTTPIVNNTGNSVIDLANYEGSHVGFNESGSKSMDPTRIIALADHTIKRALHGFLGYNSLIKRGVITEQETLNIPTEAITIGLYEILYFSKKIAVAANGEDKRISAYWSAEGVINENVTSSYLQDTTADSLLFYFDEEAASLLSIRPWHESYQGDRVDSQKRDDIESMSDDILYQAFQEIIESTGIPLDDIRTKNLQKIGFKKSWLEFLGSKPQSEYSLLEEKKQEFKNKTQKAIKSKLPKNQRVLIVSPHPDDDVISMGGTIQKLVANGNEVYVLVVTSGANAVRETETQYQTHLNEISQHNFKKDEKDDNIEEMARRLVREDEARNADMFLGVNKIHFFNADFYKRRGIPSVEAFSENDKQNMQNLLLECNPDRIYFAAEPDPRGAHGLSKKLVQASTLEIQKNSPDFSPLFFGYRGAYLDWSLGLVENLQIEGFNDDLLRKKLKSIQLHKSQLDMVVTTDERSLTTRALVRNKGLAKTLLKVDDDNSMSCAEAFQVYTTKEFLSLE